MDNKYFSSHDSGKIGWKLRSVVKDLRLKLLLENEDVGRMETFGQQKKILNYSWGNFNPSEFIALYKLTILKLKFKI